MKLHWTSKGSSDLIRLHQFSAALNPSAAEKILSRVAKTIERLLVYPRLGTRIDQHPQQEIRRLIAGIYEIRYEIRKSDIYIIRIWHTREKR